MCPHPATGARRAASKAKSARAWKGSAARGTRSPAVHVVGWRGGQLVDRDTKAPHVGHGQVDPPDEGILGHVLPVLDELKPVEMLSDQASRSGVAQPNIASTVCPTGFADRRQ